MSRPTPALIFCSTGALIALLLGLLTTLQPAPASVQAAAPAFEAAAGAPEIYPLAPRASEKAAPAPTQVQASPSPPVVEPVFSPPPAAALEQDLAGFVRSLTDGSARLAGVFAPGRFAFPIVRQPEGDPIWVSGGERDVTLFDAPLDHRVTALLAHNNLAGRQFATLSAGQELVLVYGDGHIAAYRITTQQSFQAVEPRKPTGDFIDLTTGERLTSNQVFARFYTGAYPLVLQTCIERDGDYFWGRLFLLAEPLD